MKIASWHTFQILTKRPVFMDKLVPSDPLPNVWLGVSVENQQATSRIPYLEKTPAAVRFISCEPLLEAVDLKPFLKNRKIDLVIVGGESGHKARPMNEDWVRSLRDQCQEANVHFFYKQKTENKKKISLPILDGRMWAEMPIKKGEINV